MSVRRTVAGSLTGALVASALLVAAAPSAHAVEPDDTTFTPVAADLIGVGSDTSQHAVWSLAQAWNGALPAPAFKVATYAATGGGTIALPGGSITRPNGSGSGKNLLRPATNNPDVDFARSSSALSTAEVNDGLKALPFAVDELALAVSNSTPSNAPVSLTTAQIVQIYKGEVTNWNQVGGSAGVIEAKIPQAGSGTRAFFEAQLKSLNGDVAVNVAGLAEVQEHDDTAIKNNPNAIVPFSKGRAGLLGSTLRIEAGWTAQRALYNVVRGAELADSKIQAVFGPTGFVCSDAALSLIEAAGFGQLDSEADGGECGVQTTLATTNFQVNGEETATSTVLTAVSNDPGQVTLTATVTSDPAATGTVTFKEGANVVASGVALTGGVATTTITGVTAGAHTYTAVFAPGAGFGASQDDADPVTVAAVATATSTSTAASSPSARTVSLRANVTPIAGAGTVTFREGATVVATGVPVVNGVATKSLTSVKPGSHSYAAQFVPTNATAFAGSTDATPASVLVRTTASITESFPTATSRGARGKGTVTVALVGTTTKATGKVVLKVGTKVVGSGTLSKGKVTITLIKMSRGKKKVVITWAGNTLAPKKTKSFYITQR